MVPAGVLQFAARKIPGFGQWYAVTIYPWIVGIYGRICGLVPFSVVEMGLYGLVLFFRIQPVVGVSGSGRKMFAGVFFTAGLLAFLYTANCGVNYYRETIFLLFWIWQMGKATTEDLKGVVSGTGGEKSVRQHRKSRWIWGFWPRENWRGRERRPWRSWREEYPALSGCYPVPANRLWCPAFWQCSSFAVCILHLRWSANYNWQMTGYNIRPHHLP